MGQWKECHPRNYNTTARWWNPLASSFCHISKSLPKRQTISAQFGEHLATCQTSIDCLDISKDMYCITGHLCGSKSSAKQETTCEQCSTCTSTELTTQCARLNTRQGVVTQQQYTSKRRRPSCTKVRYTSRTPLAQQELKIQARGGHLLHKS